MVAHADHALATSERPGTGSPDGPSWAVVSFDISGIQDYIFDVADGQGGQARELRARSFELQSLTEIAVVELLARLHWERKDVRIAGAGRAILTHQIFDAGVVRQKVAKARADFELACLATFCGALRVHLGVGTGESEVAAFQLAGADLARNKLQPWHDGARASDGRWNPDELVLAPISTPCPRCRLRPQAVESGSCSRCDRILRWGRELPAADRVAWRRAAMGNHGDWLGWEVSLVRRGAAVPAGTTWWAALDGQHPDAPISRPLGRHVPTDRRGAVVEFEMLARAAAGAPKLAVLKIDGDAVGAAFARTLEGVETLDRYADLSRRLDGFMVETCEGLSRSPAYRDRIYVVFAGGDDLVVVAPWDAALWFAGELAEAFQSAFRDEGLTMSAGLALFPSRYPMRHAVATAEAALERAKEEAAPGRSAGRGQCAAFGAVWAWADHATILANADKLSRWIGGVDRQHRTSRASLFQAMAALETLASDPATPARLHAWWTRSRELRGACKDWFGGFVEDVVAGTVWHNAWIRPALTIAELMTRESRDDG